jgi:hypothetical protein
LAGPSPTHQYGSLLQSRIQTRILFISTCPIAHWLPLADEDCALGYLLPSPAAIYYSIPQWESMLPSPPVPIFLYKQAHSLSDIVYYLLLPLHSCKFLNCILQTRGPASLLYNVCHDSSSAHHSCHQRGLASSSTARIDLAQFSCASASNCLSWYQSTSFESTHHRDIRGHPPCSMSCISQVCEDFI